jgi:hypothetical protein
VEVRSNRKTALQSQHLGKDLAKQLMEQQAAPAEEEHVLQAVGILYRNLVYIRERVDELNNRL